MRRVQRLRGYVVMVFFLGLSIIPLTAQQADAEGKRLEIFEVDPNLRANIWEILSSEFRTYQMGDSSVAVLETPERLQKAREMLQYVKAIRRDVGGATQSAFVVSVVGASLNGSFLEGTPLPENLQPAANELKAMFPYQSYRLLDSTPIRVALSALDDRRNTGMAYQGSSTLGPCTTGTDARCIQNISILRAISGEPIKLSNFSYSLRAPRPQKRVVESKEGKEEHVVYDQLAFTTSVDIAKGQTLVVGKLNPDSAQTAYFITVTRLQD